MRAAITGSTGFVGAFLAAHLIDEGDDVIRLSRRNGFELGDAKSVRTSIEDSAPDVIYHLAALTNVAESWADPALTTRVNVEGTRNLLDAALRSKVSRVIIVGSAEQYGSVDPSDLPLREDAPMRPITPYGESKVAAEQLAVDAFTEDGLPTLCVRPFSHTGPGQTDRFVVPALTKRIIDATHHATPEIKVGSLDPVRDILDVRDVVRAYRLLALTGVPGEAYNVCSGMGVTIRAIAERLLTLAHSGAQLVVDPELVRPIEVPVLIGDGSKIRAVTGWAPLISLDETLRDLIAHGTRTAP